MANPKPLRRFTPEQAREAGAKGRDAQAVNRVSLADPQALADASLCRLVVVEREMERMAQKLQGRDKVEAAKVLVMVAGMVQDRTRGKPRPTPEGQALPDDYAKAVREANKRAQALASSEDNGDDPDHNI